MKIADVTVGTEYAVVNYQSRNESEWRLLERARREVVRSIHPGGKVRLSRWDAKTESFGDSTYLTRAVDLVMPWAEAVPIMREIRRDKIRRAKEGQERVARKQVALRAVGQFLENHDMTGMPGLPWTLKGAIALANGDEGLKDMGGLGTVPTHRHEPKVEVNVTTLLALLRMAYSDGQQDWNREAAAWSKPSAD